MRWWPLVGLAACGGEPVVLPADCSADETYLESYCECGEADECIPAGPSCLPACSAPEDCLGGYCQNGGACVPICG